MDINRIKKWQLMAVMALIGFQPKVSQADFFGGDIPLLIEILSNSVQQLAQLQAILGNGKDTLNYFKEINDGPKAALQFAKLFKITIDPGVLSQIQNSEEFLKTLQTMYGPVPKTSESKLQSFQDQSVAEAMTLHNKAFQYAGQSDQNAQDIKSYAERVSPLGANRLTAQSIGTLIEVNNQILRTNAAILKVLSENLALQNRKEKLNSEQFQMQYEGLSSALSQLTPLKKNAILNSSRR